MISATSTSALVGLALVVALFAKEIFSLYQYYARSVRLIHNYPGYRILFHPHTLFGLLLPRIPGVNLGDQYIRRLRLKLFEPSPHDVVSLVAFFPPGRIFHVADATAIKYIVSDRNRYVKPKHLYAALAQKGDNLAVTEGDIWRRHKKIIAGSMTERTAEHAFSESSRVLEDCLLEFQRKNSPGTDGKRQIDIPDFLDLTSKIGIFIICSTSFSMRSPWSEDEREAIPQGHSLLFRTTVSGVIDGSMLHHMTPKWARWLPIPRLRHVVQCYKEFDVYIRDMIAERRALAGDLRDNDTGDKDLLGALLHARAEADIEEELSEKGSEKGRPTLSDDELLGNIYVFLLAGHETAANALAFAFVLLALYQDEQDQLYQSIIEAIPLDAEPTYADFPKLHRVQAAFYETLRLFPAVVVPKMATEGNVIPTAPNEDGTPSSGVYIPKWSEVYINNVALHRNPRYWGQDCNVFRPNRFLDAPDGSYKWPREAFLSFSAGHRACIGQKFASVTACVTIALLLRKYSVHLPEDVYGTAPEGETFEEKVERVTTCKAFIALTLKSSHLVFRER